MSALSASVPTLANVVVFVAVFTAMGRSGLLEGPHLLWGLAWPLFLLLNAPLHEASHALAGLAAGQRVLEFVAWRLAGNHVRFGGPVGWPVTAAPFLRDLLSLGLSAALLGRLSPRRRWLWMGLFMAGMLLPLWDTILEYAGLFVGGSTDVFKLVVAWGPAAVHLCFALVLVAYLVLIGCVLRQAARRVGA